MENKQEEGKVVAGNIMYIRGVPFNCPTTAATDREKAVTVVPVSPTPPAVAVKSKPARVEGCEHALEVNTGFCTDNLLPGRAMAAAGRCGRLGTVSLAQAELMKSRRSVRVFADNAVSMRVLRDLVAAASLPEPGETPGLARFVMVESTGAMDRVTELAAAWLRREGILADGLGPEAKAREVVFGGAPHMAVAFGPRGDAAAAAACSLVVARLEWLAAGLGLGACYAGEMVRAASGCPELAAALSLPDTAEAYAAVFLGQPGTRRERPAVIPGTRIVWL